MWWQHWPSLWGRLSGDRKLLIKPNSVQNALHINTNNNNSCITIPETLPPEEVEAVGTQRKNIYANPDIHLTVVREIKREHGTYGFK